MNIGDRFGKWTVTSDTLRDGGRTKVTVKCDCGTERVVLADNLVQGQSKSCGSCKNTRPGQRFGRLLVTSNQITDKRHPRVRVKCDCGVEKTARVDLLRAGRLISCGCFQKDNPPSFKHGGVGTRIHRIWVAMRHRCRSKQYKHHAGRGITVCEEWLKFETFRDWAMSNGYDGGLSIDRIKGDKGYSPNNCRWTTYTVQSQNKRKQSNNTSGYIGVEQRVRGWIARASYCNRKVHLGTFDTAIEAAQARDKYVKANYESPTLNFPEGQSK